MKTLTITIITAIILIVVTAFVAQDHGFQKGFQHKTEEFYNFDNKIKLKEIPFEPDLDFQEITNSIANVGKDPTGMDRKQFNKSVKNINQEILNYLSENLHLSEAERKAVIKQYNLRHKNIAEDFYNQLKDMKGSDIMNENDSFITYDTYKSTDHFNRILASTICNMSGLILTIATGDSPTAKPIGLFLEEPCGFILSYLLKPLEGKLKEWALIRDYSMSELKLKRHIRDMIVELATVEDQYQVNWRQQYVRELRYWFWDSEANLEIQLKSKVKAGFRLNKFFNLRFDHGAKQIILTLPEPEILSNEVDPRVVDMEDGLLVDIDEKKINEVLVKGKHWSYEKAIEEGILEKAIENSELILKSMFQPIVAATDHRYKIIIKFKSASNEQTHILLDYDQDEVDTEL